MVLLLVVCLNIKRRPQFRMVDPKDAFVFFGQIHLREHVAFLNQSTTNGHQHDHCRLQAIGAEFCKLAQTRESCDLEKAVGVRS